MSTQVKNKNPYIHRRNFFRLALGITVLPSLVLSEERNFNPMIKGWAIQDPFNKQKVRGFVHIPTVWGEQLKIPESFYGGKNYRSLLRANIGLVEAIKKYTDIDANNDPHLYLSSNKLMEYPFLYIATDKAFELTKTERDNFEYYLRNGGFAVLESFAVLEFYWTGVSEYSSAEASLKQMIRDVLKKDARFLPIPNSHHLYHCFFNFNDGPPQGTEVSPIRIRTVNPGDAAVNWNDYTFPKPRYYLEGVFLDDRLAVVYSGKGYGQKWKDLINNEPQQKMAVNFVIFALTQKGRIAQKDKLSHSHSYYTSYNILQ